MTATTRSYGIDLASKASRTAVCAIEWNQSGAGYVDCPGDHGPVDELLSQMTNETVTRIGIDAPFGWPSEFLEAVGRYHDAGVWPDSPGQEEHQALMRLRETDRFVQQQTGLFPLSVSTDKIAICAMRCARLLAAYWQKTGEHPDRSGAGRVIEVYPAAALVQWNLSPRRHPDDPGTYKGKTPEATTRRKRIVDSLRSLSNNRLEMSEKTVNVCIQSDDCLDAVICALVARAADLRHTLPVADPVAADSEGWITLPRKEAISALFTNSSRG